MLRLGASYKIGLRLINDPVAAGYDATVGDVFTDVVRDEAMRNESFNVNVTARFLQDQPTILLEASALHEVCHVMNDDLPGYHRNGANIEAAEERCVLQAVGESRYEQYLHAYAAYHHWDRMTYERVLQKVKDVTLVPPPREIDEVDRLAAAYFRLHADGGQHFLVYNGALHDATLWSTRNDVRPDLEKLKAIIRAGRPMICFHNHPEDGRAAMFPSDEDFEVAALAKEASIEYLQHVCPAMPVTTESEVWRDPSGIFSLAERSVFHPPSRAITFFSSQRTDRSCTKSVSSFGDRTEEESQQAVTAIPADCCDERLTRVVSPAFEHHTQRNTRITVVRPSSQVHGDWLAAPNPR